MTAIALTIAGSDSGGGAGIQADLKTFSALGAFGTSVISAVTAQNTQGVQAVEDVSPSMIGAQIDAIFADMAVGATKIGMVSRVETIAVIVERLKHHNIRPIVDPVMVATSGDRLLNEDAIGALRRDLLPLAAIVTPNLPEAALLTDTSIAENEASMIAQAKALVAMGAQAALVKGGHATGQECIDVLYDGVTVTRLSRPRIDTSNSHGTGCTLSAAIAAGLAKGQSLEEATCLARDYLQAALIAGASQSIGRGRGPVHHFHRWWPTDGS